MRRIQIPFAPRAIYRRMRSLVQPETAVEREAAHAVSQLRSRLLLIVTPARVLVAAAILVASMLRFVDLDTIPPALNQDEVVNGYDAYSLFLSGRDHHGHPFPFAGLESFGDWASPLLTFLTVPAVGLFGLSAGVIRGVSAAIGVMAVPIVYLLGCELFRRRSIGVLAAWFIAVSPWHVHRSRFAIPPAVVPTMVALTMLALVWTVRRQSARGMVALAISAGLTIAGYPTMKLYVPLLLLAAFVIYRQTVIRLNREALCYAAIIFIIITGPILYLSLADPGGRARLDQVSIFKASNVNVLFLAHQYETYFSPWVFFVAGNGHPGQSPATPGFGVELRSALPFLLAGGLWLLRTIFVGSMRQNRQSALLLVAALVLYPIPGSLTLPTPPLVGPNLSRAIHPFH
jgi:4-amino-4-deoxy-L-arabinose transferase-like glycosyltransferase